MNFLKFGIPFQVFVLFAFLDIGFAQVPTVRFSTAQVSVSQKAGAVQVPISIDNSDAIPGGPYQFISVYLDTNDGTARAGTDFTDNTFGSFFVYQGTSQIFASIPIHYTCSPNDKTFAVLLSADAYTPVATGNPTVLTVTIRGVGNSLNAPRAKLAKVQRKIRKARRIRSSTARRRVLKRLNRQKRSLKSLLCK